MAISFKVNGGPVSVDAPQDTSLLWVIREHPKLTGTKFGCGVALCGACVVHNRQDVTVIHMELIRAK